MMTKDYVYHELEMSLNEIDEAIEAHKDRVKKNYVTNVPHWLTAQNTNLRHDGLSLMQTRLQCLTALAVLAVDNVVE